ncbi:hypothetical protein V6N12_032460 [Hibiscus sabdariffa]|uniref:RIN4 pathogenic type III effector avirulence factor Avr cleavage site domain-containing protein n=1 Tax=Hibiscus sabdariffa TaxID=183260 RepID=A0ABR2CCM8_9ROSI
MSFLKEQEDMSEAKLHSHVPKLGEWDNDDRPYTTYFKNARKDKAGTIDLRGLESNHDCSKSESTDKHRTSGASRNGSTDHQKSARRQRNMGPESGGENVSGSGGTHMHSNHHRRTSSCPKTGPAGGGSFSGLGNYEYKHQRTTSVPKFGEWDETDPTSGEGFTVIFNKVKEEKHAPQPSNFATVAPEVETMDYSDCHHKKCPTPSWGSKSKQAKEDSDVDIVTLDLFPSL